jgi:hypothetical protein
LVSNRLPAAFSESGRTPNTTPVNLLGRRRGRDFLIAAHHRVVSRFGGLTGLSLIGSRASSVSCMAAAENDVSVGPGIKAVTETPVPPFDAPVTAASGVDPMPRSYPQANRPNHNRLLWVNWPRHG